MGIERLIVRYMGKVAHNNNPEIRFTSRALTSAAILTVFLVALLVRLAPTAAFHPTPISDFQGYQRLAEDWIANGYFGHSGAFAYRTPGYPAFLATIWRATSPAPEVAALAQAILGALSSALLALLGLQVLPLRAAVLAGMLFAFSVTSIAYVPLLASENLAVLFVVSGLLLVVLSHRRAMWYVPLCGAGAIFSLLLLTRPAALFFLPGWLLLVVWDPPRRRWRLHHAPLFLVVMVLVLLPWVERNQRVGLGAVLSTSGGMNLWMGNNDLARLGGWQRSALTLGDLPEAERDRAYRQQAITWIRAHPRAYAKLCTTRARRLLGTEPDLMLARHFFPTYEDDRAVVMAYHAQRAGTVVPPEVAVHAAEFQQRNGSWLRAWRYVVAPLTLAGVIFSLWRWRAYAVAVLPAASYLLGLSLTYTEVRFRELSDPLLFVPLGGLLAMLASRLLESRGSAEGGDPIGAATSLRTTSSDLRAGRPKE